MKLAAVACYRPREDTGGVHRPCQCPRVNQTKRSGRGSLGGRGGGTSQPLGDTIALCVNMWKPPTLNAQSPAFCMCQRTSLNSSMQRVVGRHSTVKCSREGNSHSSLSLNLTSIMYASFRPSKQVLTWGLPDERIFFRHVYRCLPCGQHLRRYRGPWPAQRSHVANPCRVF